MIYDQKKKEFIKKLEGACTSHSPYNVFTDWCLCSALALSQVPFFRKDREEKYLSIIGKYDKEVQAVFPELLAIVVQAFESRYGDFLGEIYMDCGFGSSNQGQFFTPYSVCQCMAKMQGLPKENKIITISDCAVGGGALVIAYAEHLKENGVNFQNYMLADVTDISINSVSMAMIQFSLLGIPSIIRHGNSLTLETWDIYETPITSINFVKERLKIQKESEKLGAITSELVGQLPEQEKIISPETPVATREYMPEIEQGQGLLF